MAKSRLERLNNSLYYVKGVKGDMIPTESVYAAFVEPLSEFTQSFEGIEYINTSLVGAQIDGFENMSLEDAIKDSSSVEKQEFVGNSLPDKAKVLSNLENKLKELLEAIPMIEEGRRLAKSLNNDLKRYRNAGAEVLKSLKKLSVNYLALSSNFIEKSELFDFITTADKINLDYEMKMLREFTYDSVLSICEKISAYYDNAEKRIREVEGLINESLNSEG